MNADISAFLPNKAVRYTAIEVVVSKRFKGKDGQPIPWRVKVLSNKTMTALQKECSRRIIDKATGQERIETDQEKLGRRLIEECVIYPALKNPELQDAYHATGAADLAEAMLLPGELSTLMKAVSEAQGIDSGLEDRVKYVKN